VLVVQMLQDMVQGTVVIDGSKTVGSSIIVAGPVQ